MFYVDFIINMTYNTHNKTTLLKKLKSDKKNKYIWNDITYTPLQLFLKETVK